MKEILNMVRGNQRIVSRFYANMKSFANFPDNELHKT